MGNQQDRENQQGQNTQGQGSSLNFEIGTNWDQQKRRLREQYPQLTDSDLNYQRGQERELLSRVETRLNKQSHEVINIFNRLNNESNDNESNESEFGGQAGNVF